MSDPLPYSGEVAKLPLHPEAERRLANRGGGGDSTGMDGFEKRLSLVESDLRAMRADLATVNTRLGTIDGKLDVLTTQVVAKIPNAWTLFGMMSATMVSLVTLAGVALALLRYFGFFPRPPL